MNSSRFGPIAWSLLQSLPCALPAHVLASDRAARESLLVVLSSLAFVLPCRYCRLSYRQFIVRVNLREWLQTPDVLSNEQVAQWLFLVHNEVNRKLNKPVYLQRADVYDKCVLRDERKCIDTLCTWLYIVWMAVGDREREQAQALMIPNDAQRALAYTCVRRCKGRLLCAANDVDGTLGSLVHETIDRLYARYFTNDDAAAKDRWRKYAWHVLHTAHLALLLQRAHWSRAAQTFLQEILSAVTGSTEQSRTIGETADDVLRSIYKAHGAYERPTRSFDSTLDYIGTTYRVS